MMDETGRIDGIFIAPKGGATMIACDEIEAIKSRGLVGDRYFSETGHSSNVEGWGANVTLIEREAIEAVNNGYGIKFSPEMLRRNLVTSNAKLENLIGKEFQIGSVVLKGLRKYPPCIHLAQLLRTNDVLKAFAYCGGIGAEVLQGGRITIGDDLIIRLS